MKYMFLIAGEEDAWRRLSPDEQREAYERVADWWRDNAAAGKILEGHELQASTTATTVRVALDGTTVTDGPFVEGKEMVGGYGIVDVPDLDAAIALASSWPGETTIEIRPVAVREQ